MDARITEKWRSLKKHASDTRASDPPLPDNLLILPGPIKRDLCDKCVGARFFIGQRDY